MKHVYIIAALVFSIIVTGCKKNQSDTPASVEKAPISLHLHSYIGSNEVGSYNTVYRTTDNRKISLSFSQLYISNIQLVKFDGTIYNVGDTIFLTNIIDEVYGLGNVPVGNYKSIKFDVGLPSTVNARIPSGTGKLNNSNMWFSSTTQVNNYIFMNVSGKIDTTAAMNAADAAMVPFVYKIGTNNNVVHVSMPNQNVSVQPGTTAYMHMKADYAELFNGLNLIDKANLSVVTVADNASSLAIDISANISNMFKYE